MYTQCPECKSPYSVTAEQLRASHGEISCEACSAIFDALELLNEGAIPNDIEINEFPSYLDDSINNSSFPKLQAKHWGLGICFLLLGLTFQIYFFKAYALSQNTTLRPWLEKACNVKTNCQLPPYKNLDELTILNGSFEPVNDHYLFKTAFINQSIFAQQQPSIKLTLLDFTGHSFAERIFHPEHYSKQPLSLLKPDIPVEITISIATPLKKIGGYRFELI